MADSVDRHLNRTFQFNHRWQRGAATYDLDNSVNPCSGLGNSFWALPRVPRRPDLPLFTLTEVGNYVEVTQAATLDPV